MIKAIITKYKGIDFRSRMEARTAVFLDALGIKWEYEKEGYELDNGNGEIIRYLPDFYIPKQDRFEECFIEVKGNTPTHDEHFKGLLLCNHTKLPVYFIFNFPFIQESKNGGYYPEKHITACLYQSNPEDKDSISEGAFDDGEVYDDYKYYYFIGLGGNKMFCEFNKKIMICNSEFVYTEPNDDDGHIEPCFSAYDAARNAKFEFLTTGN